MPALITCEGKERRKGVAEVPAFEVENCVQLDQHWYLEGCLGKTAEKPGGARMGLSERHGAILRGSWKLET